MGNLGLALVGRAMLSKSLIQFSAYGSGCLLFGLACPILEAWDDLQKDLFQYTPPRIATAHAPVRVVGHCQPRSPQKSLKYSQAGLAQSLVGSLLILPGSWCTQGFIVPSKSLCFL